MNCRFLFQICSLAILLAGAALALPQMSPEGVAPHAATAPASVERLEGVWRDVADPGRLVRFQEGRVTRVDGGKLQRTHWIASSEPGRLVACEYGQKKPLEFSFREDRLILGSGEAASAYERVDGPAPAFELSPLPWPGSPDVSAERIAEIQKDRQMQPPDFEKMQEVDADNVAWLKKTLQEVGWIDRERFGRAAAGTAFLIVQHSGDLQFMKTALPHLEKEARSSEGERRGGSYALLFDRYQLALGNPQRYGSQLAGGFDALVLEEVEDLSKVDARRAEMGLQPLAEYVALFGVPEVQVVSLKCELLATIKAAPGVEPVVHGRKPAPKE
jgi:hypothetical protein